MKAKLLAFLGLVVAGVGVFSLVQASPVLAAGEKYTWIDAATIEASGGSYANVRFAAKPVTSVRFKRVTDGVYTANVNLARDAEDTDVSCKIIFKLEVGTDFIGANFSASSPENGLICEDMANSSFDKRIQIANPNNGPPMGGSEVDYRTVDCAVAYAGEDNYDRCVAVKACVVERNLAVLDCLRSWNTCLINRTVNGVVAPDKRAQCASLVTAGDLAGASKGADAATGENKTTCVIPKIGWFLCPNLELLASMADGLYSIVAAFLNVPPITNEPNVYKAWEIMRNFANVAFVIVFLIIIFSQITSIGISNYGLKRLLPRLIAAAILVNVSFWICAIAVDLSNILGSSLRGLFVAMGDGVQLPDVGGAATAGTDAQDLTVQLLTGAVLVGALLYAGLSVLIPLLVVSFFTIAGVAIGLIIRQALIVLLIVISPMAFVAYLLPNTENLFNRWRQLFTALLVLYPIIALLFGAGALASAILMSVGAGA